MLARVLLVVALCASASSALADAGRGARVLVLGMRSVEGDDELANALTEQLRGVARTVDGWSVSDTAVSMAQMSLAHGCDELDAACLAEIAQSLQVERIVFGTIRRTSAREDHAFAIMLSLFDAQTGEIARQIDDTITRDQVDINSLAAHAQRMIERLLSVSSGGAIAVQANVADALVTINGQMVGQTRDGALRVEGLQPGQYRVEVSKSGYAPHVSMVSVNDGADTALAAVLTQGAAPAQAPYVDDTIDAHEGHRGGDLKWLGWTLIGVGGAALIGTFASMAVVADVNHEDVLINYRDAVAAGNDQIRKSRPDEVVSDVCAAADSGSRYGFSEANYQKVVDLCDKGATFEVLQWVFLGTAVAAAGTGTYILLSSGDDEPEEGASELGELRLRGSIAPGSATVSASLRF